MNDIALTLSSQIGVSVTGVMAISGTAIGANSHLKFPLCRGLGFATSDARLTESGNSSIAIRIRVQNDKHARIQGSSVRIGCGLGFSNTYSSLLDRNHRCRNLSTAIRSIQNSSVRSSRVLGFAITTQRSGVSRTTLRNQVRYNNRAGIPSSPMRISRDIGFVNSDPTLSFFKQRSRISTKPIRNNSVRIGRGSIVSRASSSASESVVGDPSFDKKSLWHSLVPLRRTFPLIEPFILAELKLIIRGWICTAIAVSALFLTVPRIGNLSNLLSKGDMQQLFPKAGQVLALVMVRSVAQFWQQAFLWEAALRITYKLRAHVYKRVLKRDMEYFEGGAGGAASGDVAFRLTAEAEDVGDTVHSLLHMLVPSALQLGAMGFQMVTLSPLLSFATISVVPLMFVVIAMLGEKLRQLAKTAQTSVASISAYLNEVLPAMFVVKSHAAEDFESRRFERLARADWQAHLGKKRMKAFIPEVITAVYAATAIALFGVGTWVISQGQFDGAGMVAFVTSLLLLIDPIQAMGKAYNELKQGEPAIERLFDLTNFKPKVVEEKSASMLEKVAGEVEFCNVAFRYKNASKWVLNDFSLKVRAGESVALVGPSGSGKSTLAKLLLRLYDPVQGSIRIDGHDIRDFDLKSLRKHVAIVPQETTLFTGTVAENIAYGDMSEELDMAKIEEAGRLANADDFIKSLPRGYNTHLGDRAVTLSGGQRQRLAIARAVYQGASILILDESTSALDNKSEKLVREALESLMIDHTVFVIAHRLETVRRADRIFLLDGGKLVEEGTHSTLLAKGGQYASLYSMQENSMMKRTTQTLSENVL